MEQIMPRRRPTAAKRARAASRGGVKYTAALRQEQSRASGNSQDDAPPRAVPLSDLQYSSMMRAANSDIARMAAKLGDSPAVRAANSDIARMAAKLAKNRSFWTEGM